MDSQDRKIDKGNKADSEKNPEVALDHLPHVANQFAEVQKKQSRVRCI